MVQDDVSHRKVGWNLRSGFYRVVSSKLRDEIRILQGRVQQAERSKELTYSRLWLFQCNWRAGEGVWYRMMFLIERWAGI